MKKVSIRELNSNLSKYLEELPIAVTKHGVIVATITPPEKMLQDNVATKLENSVQFVKDPPGTKIYFKPISKEIQLKKSGKALK